MQSLVFTLSKVIAERLKILGIIILSKVDSKCMMQQICRDRSLGYLVFKADLNINIHALLYNLHAKVAYKTH